MTKDKSNEENTLVKQRIKNAEEKEYVVLDLYAEVARGYRDPMLDESQWE